MRRPAGYLALAAATAAAVLAAAVDQFDPLTVTVGGTDASLLAVKALSVLAVLLGLVGLYALLVRAMTERVASKRRVHDARNVVRLVFLVVGVVGVLAVLTEQWVGLLFSLGVVGFAVTFALQQPLFSLLGWFYIVVKQPYGVGDRVRIEDTRGDVIDVDFLVTTVWEIDGELVSTNQPSGRIVTLPNSVVLSSHVYNYSWDRFPYVWNELTIQVSYETDLAFAREQMVAVADDHLGDRMAASIERYRELLGETAVELEVAERPTVNVFQQESWVELRLRYLVHPRRGTRTRNALYEAILERFNEHPERVSFPVSRNR